MMKPEDKNKKETEWKSHSISDKKWPDPEGELAIDVYQTDTEMVIQAAVAGIKSEELDISVENDLLTIKGHRKNPSEDKNRNYFFQECYWGDFSRKIIITDEIDPSRINAAMKEGILTIRIPRIIREPKSSIEIKEK